MSQVVKVSVPAQMPPAPEPETTYEHPDAQFSLQPDGSLLVRDIKYQNPIAAYPLHGWCRAWVVVT